MLALSNPTQPFPLIRWVPMFLFSSPERWHPSLWQDRWAQPISSFTCPLSRGDSFVAGVTPVLQFTHESRTPESSLAGGKGTRVLGWKCAVSSAEDVGAWDRMFRTQDGKLEPGMVNMKTNFLKGKQKEWKNRRHREMQAVAFVPAGLGLRGQRQTRELRTPVARCLMGCFRGLPARRGACSAGRVWEAGKIALWTWKWAFSPSGPNFKGCEGTNI